MFNLLKKKIRKLENILKIRTLENILKTKNILKYNTKINKEKLKIPSNIVIIPDGNRRFAKKYNISMEKLYLLTSNIFLY